MLQKGRVNYNFYYKKVPNFASLKQSWISKVLFYELLGMEKIYFESHNGLEEVIEVRSTFKPKYAKMKLKPMLKREKRYKKFLSGSTVYYNRRIQTMTNFVNWEFLRLFQVSILLKCFFCKINKRGGDWHGPYLWKLSIDSWITYSNPTCHKNNKASFTIWSLVWSC